MKKRSRYSDASRKRSYFLRSSSANEQPGCQPLNADFFSCLPVELALLIFSYIPPTSCSIRYVASCSKYFKLLISDRLTWLHHLQRDFPNLMHSLFFIKSYVNDVSSKDAIEFITQRDIDGIEEWSWKMRATNMLVPLGKTKNFYEYLHRVCREMKPNQEAINFNFVVNIADYSLLRWQLSLSGFRSKTFDVFDPNISGPIDPNYLDLHAMNEISKLFPVEFPCVLVSESQDICVPVCAEYVAIDGRRFSSENLSDITFENIGNHPLMSIKGVRFSNVPTYDLVRWMSSLRSEMLIDLEVISYVDDDEEEVDIVFPIELSRMKSLQRLYIESYEVNSLSFHSISTLKHLSSLSFVSCAGFYGEKFPSSIRNLKELEVLSVCYCDLDVMHTSIGGFPKLKQLYLRRCPNLMQIPSSIGKLVNLETLTIAQCPLLVQIPFSIGKLLNLVSLDLGGCCELMELPSSIAKLRKLVSLDLSECVELFELPSLRGLPNLAVLYAADSGVSENFSLLRASLPTGCEIDDESPTTSGAIEEACLLMIIRLMGAGIIGILNMDDDDNYDNENDNY